MDFIPSGRGSKEFCEAIMSLRKEPGYKNILARAEELIAINGRRLAEISGDTSVPMERVAMEAMKIGGQNEVLTDLLNLVKNAWQTLEGFRQREAQNA